MSLPYLPHLASDSDRFARILHDVPSSTRVPSCPDWDADDLLWHLGSGHRYWTAVLVDGLTGDEAEAATPERPGSRAGLESFFAEASAGLVAAFGSTPPQTPVWTWHPSDQTAGFLLRRMAHEALIHRVDAELTAGVPSALDPALAADGVDEILKVFYGGEPPWGRLERDPSAGPVRIRATDTGSSWLVRFGLFSGTTPEGKVYENEPDLDTARDDPGPEVEPAAATIEGRAADLDRHLWRRLMTPSDGESLRFSGDPVVLKKFDETIAGGIG